MGTKELGWSAARFSAVRFLALAMSVSAVALALPAGAAHAADQKKARDKIVEFNKQALLSYEAKDFETAKTLLTKALKEAKQSGLEDDKMTARTYLHLGAVYWVGFQDQAVALQNFSLAKKIRPDIQLTPSIETPDLKSVFDLAVVEPEAAPEPPPAKATTTARPQPRATAQAAPQLTGDGSGEPDLPASMSAPLMCTVPDTVPPEKELSIRCALKPGLNAKVVQLHHRAPGVEAYQVLAMRKTAKGWYLATLPGHVMKVGTLQLYFDARDGSDNEIASNGQVDSPSIIEIRKKGGAKSIGTEEEDPMERIRREQRAQVYEAGLHRRRQGAFWFGVGGGGGWGFAPAGTLEWESQIRINAITTTTGQFHVLPEIGWMYSDDFALALQGRIEFYKQQQGTWKDPNGGQIQQINAIWMDGAPTTMAAAVFGRAIWYTDLSASGNFQLSYSGDIGGGFVRFPVLPSNLRGTGDLTQDSNGNYSPKPTAAIALTDSRAVGPFLVGASAGFIYHLSRHFALAIEGRFITGFPSFGAVFEGGFSAQVALGGAKAVAQTGDDGEGEGGGVNDAPPPADSRSEEEE
jgi:hypothetical protein